MAKNNNVETNKDDETEREESSDEPNLQNDLAKNLGGAAGVNIDGQD